MVSQTAYNFQKPHVKTDSGNGKFWSETATVFGKRELAHSLLSWENKAAHHQQEFLGIPSPPPGFYLGYLRGRSFPPPPQNAQLPLQKINIVVITVFSNYIVTAGHCPHCNTSPNCVSKCTKLHLSTYSFQKFWGGRMPLDHPRKLVAFGHSGLLPQTINPR